MIGVLLKLIPDGLYEVEAGTTVRNSLEGEAAALDTLDQAADDLVLEMFPQLATVTLDDWERVLGIVPPAGATDAQRRAYIHARKALGGGLSMQHVKDLAELILGYEPAIREQPIAVVGPVPWGIVGEARIGTYDDLFTWHLDIDPGVTDFATFERTRLEDLIEAARPGHTVALVGFMAPFMAGMSLVGKDKL